ncbi:MAG: hypothetical protein PHU08_06080 [Dehalococcoidales bacterium]|nr:hypothetical protein [Dehalococcoidales bacterium]
MEEQLSKRTDLKGSGDADRRTPEPLGFIDGLVQVESIVIKTDTAERKGVVSIEITRQLTNEVYF